jgi:hypothetical protein
MIAEDWFHGNCVGISKKEAERKQGYTCPQCEDAPWKCKLASFEVENILDVRQSVDTGGIEYFVKWRVC